VLGKLGCFLVKMQHDVQQSLKEMEESKLMYNYLGHRMVHFYESELRLQSSSLKENTICNRKISKLVQWIEKV